MNFQFNEHRNLEGCHAFLGASSYHWLNYSDEKLRATYENSKATERGTRLHALAKELIELGVKLPRNSRTLNAYVNDAIGYGMKPEVVLYYSPFCFGTCDAIAYDSKRHTLRIHDLKTGASPADMRQLMIYAALFCLEYHIKPETLEITLCIYQFDSATSLNPTAEEIQEKMDAIVHGDQILAELQEG